MGHDDGLTAGTRPGPPDDAPGPRLTPPVLEALDALAQAGWRIEAVAWPQREAARRVLSLLSALELGPAAGSEELDDRVRAALTRVASSRSLLLGVGHDAGSDAAPAGWLAESDELTGPDQDALEALVASGYQPERTSAAVRPRAAALARLLSAIETPLGDPAKTGPAGSVGPEGAGGAEADREARVRATMARVQTAVRSQEDRLKLDTTVTPGRSWRLGNLVAAAAVLAIGGIVLSPVLAGWRAESRRVACLDNMAAAGLAFGQYAGDFRSALPMASASLAGTPWWFVGQGPERSNSANLFTLASSQYTTLDRLACPGNAAALRGKAAPMDHDWASLEQVSYSYQNLFARERRRWEDTRPCGSRVEIMLDRSPVILRNRRGEWADPMENSPNHAGRGQTALQNDGSAVWMATPVTADGDNVWLPRAVEEILRQLQTTGRVDPLKGIEEPACAEDTFAAP